VTPDDEEEEEYTGTGTGLSTVGEVKPALPAAPAPPPVLPSEEITQPFDLKRKLKEDAKERRRAFVLELHIKRPKVAEVKVSVGEFTTIGRETDCDVVVQDDSVSGRHARIKRTETGHYELTDLGSTNGTRVDEHPIDRMILLDGDRFSIGETKFTVRLVARDT
jgi:hypothetical protein